MERWIWEKILKEPEIHIKHIGVLFLAFLYLAIYLTETLQVRTHEVFMGEMSRCILFPRMTLQLLKHGVLVSLLRLRSAGDL